MSRDTPRRPRHPDDLTGPLPRLDGTDGTPRPQRPWPEAPEPSPREQPRHRPDGERAPRQPRPERGPPRQTSRRPAEAEPNRPAAGSGQAAGGQRPWPEQPTRPPPARAQEPERYTTRWQRDWREATGSWRRNTSDFTGPMPRADGGARRPWPQPGPARQRGAPPEPPRLRERAFGPPTGELHALDPGFLNPETGEFRRVVLEPPPPAPPRDDGYEYPEVVSGSKTGSVAGGLGWQSLAAMVTQGAQAAVAMIIAANVAPAEYSLITIASVLFGAQFLTNTLGLGTALVYYDDRRSFRAALDGAAWLNLLLGVMIAALAFVTAPLTAGLFTEGFERSEVVRVIQVMSLMFLAAAAIEIPQGIIEKTRDFRRRAIPEITGSLSFAVFALSMLALGNGVWGSIWGRIVQFGTLAAGLQLLTPMRPRLLPRIDWAVIRKLLRYGKFLGLSTVFTFLLANAGSVSIGSLAGAEALGAYGLAFTITNLVPTFLGQTLGKVFFPLYASIRHNNDRLMAAYDNAGHLTGVVMFPVTGLLLTVGPDALVYVFGPEWEPAQPLIRVLALYGLARGVSNTNIQLLNATGRPNLTMWNSVLAVSVPLVLLWPATVYGAVGITAAFTVGQLISATVTTVGTIAYTTMRLLRYLMAPATATAAAAVESLAVSQILHGRVDGLAAGVLEVGVFGVTYLFGLMALDDRMRGLASKVLRRFRPAASS